MNRTILEERAAQLARPVDQAVRTGEEVLEFAIDRERYGLALPEVAGIFRLTSLGILPGATEPLVGIASWHGAMLRVLDLRALHHQRAEGLEDRAWVVAVGARRPAFGLLVSRVAGLRALPAIVGAPPEGVATDRRFLLGTTGDGLQILNPAALYAAFAPGESR